MSVISTSKFTERMSRRLQRAGRNEWVAQSSGDAWGKYLIFRCGGRCIAGAGWTQSECESIVNERCATVGEEEEQDDYFEELASQYVSKDEDGN